MERSFPAMTTVLTVNIFLIIDELKSQTGDNNVDGVGTITVTENSPNVTGAGTAFTSDDVNKRIIIAGVTYVIKRA